MSDRMIKLGMYDEKFNKLIGQELESMDIYYSRGLSSHLLKRHHYKALKYINNLPEIISCPDYVGFDPKEPDSIEFVKMYEDNIWVGIKIDKDEKYYYVSTMYDVQMSKISRRLHSGRIKLVVAENTKDEKFLDENIDKMQ